MEKSSQQSLQINAIRRYMSRIVDEWIQLHFRLAIVFVAVAFIVEIIFAIFIVQSSILTTTIWRYILKYILIPTGISVMSLFVCKAIIRSSRISRNVKIYVVSLLLVLFCFIYYTAHSAFIAVYALYAFAIFLTATYADYRLTCFVTFASVASIVISEFWLHWDLDKVSIFSDSIRMIDFFIAVAILIGCCIVASVTIQYEKKKNEASIRKEVERELLKDSLLHDEFTGVFNRKALHDALHRLETEDLKKSIIFGIADIDHFKDFNDRHGHHIGDLALTEFACILSDYFGENSVYRYGGDEFCLILRNISLEETILRCKRLQERFSKVEFEDITDLKPTVCFGLTVLHIGGDATQVFNQADEALYEAKKTRNDVCVYGRSSSSAS